MIEAIPKEVLTKLEPGARYAIQLQRPVSVAEVEAIRQRLQEAAVDLGVKFVVLDCHTRIFRVEPGTLSEVPYVARSDSSPAARPPLSSQPVYRDDDSEGSYCGSLSSTGEMGQ